MEDRRKHVRFKSETIMQYKSGFFTLSDESVTKDLSLGGVCFFSEKKMKSGQTVSMKLYYDSKSSARVMKGKIAWSRKCNDGFSQGYLNGVTFIR